VTALDRALLAIAAAGVLLRLLHLFAVSATPIIGYHTTLHESDMYMFDQWAQRITQGDVLGRQAYHPLNGWQLQAAPLERWKAWYGEAPVFYKAPFYPYLVAALYRLAGDAIVPLALLQILAAGVSVVLLGRIGAALLGEGAGLGAAGLYALYAPDVHFDVVMLRGPWIVLVSLVATGLLVRLRARPAPGVALALGLAVGVAIVVNEAFLTVPPLVLALAALWARGRTLVLLTGAFVVGLLVGLAPVVARNVAVGTPALQLAVTGSTVYAVFNAAGSSPYFFEVRPAAFTPVLEASGGRLAATVLGCLRSFAGVGDAAAFYLQKLGGIAIPFENPDNANFYYAAVQSPLLGWLPGHAILVPLAAVGLVLAAPRLRQWLPLAPFGLSLLISILAALPLSRYRATFAVFLMPFAGLALASAVAFARARCLGRLAAVGLAVAGVFAAAGLLQDRVAFGGAPRAYFHYRPAEFLLGAAVHERQGQLAEAAEEARRLARLNPHAPTRALALLALGRLEALRGNRPAAAEALAAARRHAAGNPLLLQGIGDVHAGVLGDRAAAADCYRAALLLPGPVELRQALAERLRLLEAAPPVK
jgi:tetratricopeptide (TPR) repeat protein